MTVLSEEDWLTLFWFREMLNLHIYCFLLLIWNTRQLIPNRLIHVYTEYQKSCTTKMIVIFSIWKKKNPSHYVKWNCASISFHFHAKKEETKQPVKRDKRKCEHGIKTENANAFTRKILWTRNMSNIINHDDLCIESVSLSAPSWQQ